MGKYENTREGQCGRGLLNSCGSASCTHMSNKYSREVLKNPEYDIHYSDKTQSSKET